MLTAMTEIVDTHNRLGLKRHTVSEAGYASVLRWNGERGEPTLADPLETVGVIPGRRPTK